MHLGPCNFGARFIGEENKLTTVIVSFTELDRKERIDNVMLLVANNQYAICKTTDGLIFGIGRNTDNVISVSDETVITEWTRIILPPIEGDWWV